MPTKNNERHAISWGKSWKITVARIAAAPHPNAHALCTVPTALPRSAPRITSPISTEPAAHSPPKPKPWRPRTTSNCSKLWVKPDRKVKNANHAIMMLSSRARPTRSASTPAIQPPKAEITNALVASNPACALVICQTAINAGMAKV